MVIELPTIPEEGYNWFATDLDETILIQIDQAEYIADMDEDSAGGVTRIQFKAVGPGETNLALEYANMSPETSDYVSQNSFGMTVVVMGEGPNTVVVTPDPTGPQMATLNVGDMLVVEMPTIPEEGFEWVLPYLETAILSQVGEAKYIPDTAEGSAGGVTLFQFKAVGPGETNLALEFAKMSDDISDIVTKDAFGVTIIVE